MATENDVELQRRSRPLRTSKHRGSRKSSLFLGFSIVAVGAGLLGAPQAHADTQVSGRYIMTSGAKCTPYNLIITTVGDASASNRPVEYARLEYYDYNTRQTMVGAWTYISDLGISRFLGGELSVRVNAHHYVTPWIRYAVWTGNTYQYSTDSPNQIFENDGYGTYNAGSYCHT